MKKIKEMLRRIGTAGLAAIMLTAQMPVTAFAEEIAQPQEIVVSDDVLPTKVQTEDVLPIETDGDTATAETDGFSLYTVEFTYDNKQYVLPGDSEVALSEILDTVGLTGEVLAVEVSDESLFSAKKCKTANGSTPEKDEDGNVIEDENGTWFVFAYQAFSTEEWMKVTIGGVVYEITVTDDQANSVSYLEYNTSTYTFDTKTCASATAVTSSTSSVALGTTGQTTWYVVDGEVTISSCTIVGNVNLILKDGSTLTVNYISLINNGNSLTIYAQSSDDTTMGQLVATGNGASVAAIGGYSIEDGKEYGSLTIHGGKITATGSNDVAGIGSNTGSRNRPCGNITIYGGIVNATGKTGIGGGYNNDLKFYGGQVTADRVGSPDDYKMSIRLTMDLSHAPATDFLDLHTYVVDTVNVPESGMHYYGDPSAKVTSTLEGNRKIVSDANTYEEEKTKIINGHTYKYSGEYLIIDTQAALTALAGQTDAQSNYPFKFTSGSFSVGSDYTFAKRILISGEVALELDSGKKLTASKGIEVSTGEKLIVSGSGTLIAQGESSKSGIGAKNFGDITINGGTVDARGGDHGAGIGGDNTNTGAGTITINSGVINAVGGYLAAGIGGGHNNNTNTNGYGMSGTIVINGGQINATGLKGTAQTTGISIGNGFDANANQGSLTLGWTETTDYVYAESYNISDINFVEGKTFFLDGTSTVATTSNIGGKKIVPSSDDIAKNLEYATLSGIKDRYLYTGSTIKLDYTLTAAGENLTKGTHFTETLTRGGNAVSEVKEKGSYTLTLTGASPYTGSKSVSFIVLSEETFGGHVFAFAADDDGNYFAVDSIEALNALASYVNGGNNANGLRFKQTADINMSDQAYAPIGDHDNHPFKGTYDGDGYVILNISHKNDTTGGMSGLFGNITNGTVKNVNLKDCSFNGSNAGGIAGQMISGTIENCSVIGGTVFCGANGYSGGIVGDLYAGTVKDCFTTTKVSASSAKAGMNGSIVGTAFGYTTNNYYTVDVLNVTIYGGEQIYGGFITAGDGVTIGSGVWRTIGRTAEHTYYFGEQDDAITFSAEVPATGMKKFTATAGTLAGTSTAGTVSLTMPASDVTVSLADATLKISNIDHQTYTGSAITPEPTVKDGDKTLTKDTDYTLSYSNNINAAESTATNAPTITITGKGSYSGTRTEKFTINQKPVTVGAIKAKYKVYDNTTTAELDCSGATFAGKVDGDRLSVTATGAFDSADAGNCKTVNISNITLGGESKDNYVLAENGHQTTTTATITRATPEVTAPTASATYMENLSNVVLNNPAGNLPGTWTWATDNWINPNETAVGAVGTHVFRAKFTPTDTANYYEITKDVTVTVGKAKPHLIIDSCSSTYGNPLSVKITCDSDGKVTYVFYKSDGKTKTNTEDGAETEGGAPKNAGTYNIVASVAETSNYLSWEETSPYGCEITQAPNPAVLRSPVTVKRGTDYDLSGLVSGAKGTVNFALKELKDGYSLSGSTLTLAGTTDDSCTITVTADGTVDGKSNYETFTGEITVNATNLDPQDSFGFADVAQEKTYGDGDFTVTATGAVAGSAVTYSSSDLAVATVEADTGKVHILKVGTATITATAVATDTYASAAASYKLTVNRKPVTISGITADDLVYNSTIAQGITLNTGGAKIGGKVDGDVLTVEKAIGMCEADAGKNKTVTIRTITLGGSSKENYTVDLENSQQTTTINIRKVNILDSAITAPTGKNGLVYNGLAQALVDAGTALGGEMRYALGTATTAPADNLYSASIPTGTNVGTYYVWYKVKGDTNHNDTVPQSVQVSVAKAPHSDQYANGSAKYGASGTVDLSALIEEGGTVGTITKKDSSNVLNGDTSVSDGKLNFAFANTAGNATKTATVTVPVTSTNYADYTITVTLTVKAKEVPVLTVDPITKTYDGTAVTGAQIRGTAKVRGTEIKGTWKFEYDAIFVDAADSGAKKVIFTPEDTATYDKAEAMLALTINKAVITIKAADISIYVGDTVPSLYSPVLGKDYTVTGLVGSDRLETAPTLSYSAAPDNTKAGSYTITPGGAAVPASGNYADAIVYQTGTLTIKAKSGGGSTGGNTGGGGSSGGGGSTGGGGSSSGGNSGGGSPSPVTPSENYTVPVSGENTVEVTTEITNGNAVINEISKSDIDRIIDSGSGSKSGDESIPITIDVSQAKSEVSSVELSGKTMERLTEAVNAENNVESVEIKLTNATVTLDGAALSAINEQAEGKAVTLAVEDTNTGDLNKAQQSSLKQFDSAKPFRAAFESGGKEIHDFKGGSVRVSFSFSPEKGRDARHYHIYYLPKAGAMERLLTYYTNGLLSFVTSHFSDYAIVYDQSIENGDPVEPENPEDPEEPAKTIEMHRLYNPNSGEHFYTGNVEEKDHLVELGWNYEGVAWNAPEKSKNPVYRLYNPNAGDHHYTTDVKERDFLIKEGWNDEGIGWYSEESESVPLFRLYNPNAKMAGAHHFTADAAERDHLIEIGWRDEKTGWYGALRLEAGAA